MPNTIENKDELTGANLSTTTDPLPIVNADGGAGSTAKVEKIYPKELTKRIATGATTARYLEDRFADVVNVLDHGALGDGATDDTTAIVAALAAAAGTKSVFFPSGTYIMSTANIADGQRLVGDGVESSTIKHLASTNTSMLSVASGASMTIENLTLDGNKANNTHNGSVTQNTLLYSASAVDVNVANCRFQNFVRSGARITFTGRCRVTACDFLDGAEHDGTDGHDTSGLNLLCASASVTADSSTDFITWTGHGLSNGSPVVFQAATIPTGLVAGVVYYVVSRTANTFKVAATSGGAAIDITGNGTTVTAASQARPAAVVVQDNHFEQSDIPSVDAYSPGGVLVSGVMSSASITGNTFNRIGQNRSDNATGCIDLYTWADQCIVSDNRIFNREYVGLKLQNAGQLIAHGNIVGTTYAGAAASAAVITPAQRERSNESQDTKSDIIFQSNVLQGAGSADYIFALTGVEPLNVTNKELTSNVATLTVDVNHTLEVNDQITVTGVDATFNGTFTVTAETDTTVSYAKTAGNVGSTASTGKVVLWVSKYAERVLIADNIITGAGGGMQLSELEGNVLIRGNNVDIDDLKAFDLTNVADYDSAPTDGVITVSNNTFKSPSGQHCMQIGSGSNGDIEDINLIVRANTINCTGGGHHVRVLGTSGSNCAYVDISENIMASTGRMWDVDYVDHLVLRDNRIFSTSTNHDITGITNLEIRGNRHSGTIAETVIASGVVNITVKDYMVIDTESNAATDDLDTISPNGVDGQVIWIRSAATTRTVVLTENGNIKLPGASDSLLDTDAVASLIYSELTDKWCLVSISDNN